MVTKLEKPTRSGLIRLLEAAKVDRIRHEVNAREAELNGWQTSFQVVFARVLKECGLTGSRKAFDAKCKRLLGRTITDILDNFHPNDDWFLETPVGIRVAELIGYMPKQYTVLHYHSNGQHEYDMPVVEAEFNELRTRILTDSDLTAEVITEAITRFRTGEP